ncbi:hypothetical protein DL98DRAFT_578142 [Cadophora sp. DSE1049]|nr:hypothetical protein DL98DRAFT_578142 [Cadophora sp. DSE1049]
MIPPASTTVSLSIIDTTSWAFNIPCEDLFKPRFEGLTKLNICSYAFLITHNGIDNEKKHVLFDLGIRKDWKNLVPKMVQKFGDWDAKIQVEQDTVEILKHNSVNVDMVDAIVWSHLHWDHTGNPSTFPPGTKIIVGTGIKAKQFPGYPTNPDSDFNEKDIEGHEVVELEKHSFNIDVGRMPGYDYFGDGSFYILDAPGHSLGHLNALARTSTGPDTFIFMAADSTHLGGELRQSNQMPLPEALAQPGLVPCPCPVDVLLQLHPLHSAETPYLGLDPCFPENLAEAEETIRLIQGFDADENVFVVFAHDVSLYDTVGFFPKAANDWKVKGWKDESRWKFLVDLQKIAANRGASDTKSDPV